MGASADMDAYLAWWVVVQLRSMGCARLIVFLPYIDLQAQGID